MGDLEKRLAAKEKLTPKAGFNLVGVDDFEPAGDDLFLVGHYETRDEAEAEMDRRLAAQPSGKYYIYGPDTPAGKGAPDFILDLDPDKDYSEAELEELAQAIGTSMNEARKKLGLPPLT